MPSQKPPHFDGETGGATTAVVGILNLQVILAQESVNSWVAQAIEIDYAAGGESFDDVKAKFESGLCATVDEHLKLFGNLKKLLQPAPSELWLDLIGDGAHASKYSQWSVHEFVPKKDAFPFGQITYLLPEQAAEQLAHA